MKQRALRPALGMATALALAACAQPAQVGTQSSTPDSGNIAPGVTRVDPRVAEATDGGPFPALPSGYRGLGGAFLEDGKLIVVTPDTRASMGKHDLDIGLSHGIAVTQRFGKTAVREDDCKGAGDTPQSPIVVQNLSDPADEVERAIACAEFRNRGAHWRMSQLITKGDGYLSQVALQGDDGRVIVVYTDVNRFADNLIDALGG
jgi:hypothetical protein